ncbi:MAG: helix-hairpin-helix domain-containing protein [Bacteroidales bacterium]|nr:helix-hairpin-helix domain-containing protein [Tenuifilaceae bacterium]
MICKRFIVTVFLSIIGSWFLMGQSIESDLQSIVSNIIEDIAALSEDENIDLDVLVEDLIFFAENPINLNTATSEELEKLIFLSDFQVNALIDYRKKNGVFKTIYELQMVVGFDFSDINRLLPFVRIAEGEVTTKRRPLFKYGKNELFVRTHSLIENQAGFMPAPSSNPSATRYAGNKMGLYSRYTYSTRGGFQFGLVSEKDPGEEFFRESNPYGFDHYSAHIQVSNIGVLKNLVIGDFNADFGQGLALWTSASFGKSPDPLGVRKRAKGIFRSSSTNENRFLRGVGASVALGKFQLSAFGSYKKIDANLTDSIVDGLPQYTSLPTSGLHRTPSEIANKKSLSEFVTGGNVSVSLNKLKAGITGSLVNLGGTFDMPNQPYRYFEPPLKNRVNIGVDATYGIGNHLLFGEIANTAGYGSGIVSGALLKAHQQVHLSVIGRYYEKDFSTYYSEAFADGSSSSNESGVMVGFKILPYRNWQMNGYVDAFQSDWLKFGINSPSHGRDYLLETVYSPRSRLSFTVRYRLKQKDKNQTADDEQINPVVSYTKQAIRFHLSYNPSSEIWLKSRIEVSGYSEENRPNEYGAMFYQDISYRPKKVPIVLTARLAIFDTKSWNTRIYAYENDVLYYFSIPAYYSQGTRAYILAKYSVGQNIDIWLRFSQTFFANQEQLGSGLSQIDGPTRSDARLQVKFRF